MPGKWHAGNGERFGQVGDDGRIDVGRIVSGPGPDDVPGGNRAGSIEDRLQFDAEHAGKFAALTAINNVTANAVPQCFHRGPRGGTDRRILVQQAIEIDRQRPAVGHFGQCQDRFIANLRVGGQCHEPIESGVQLQLASHAGRGPAHRGSGIVQRVDDLAGRRGAADTTERLNRLGTDFGDLAGLKSRDSRQRGLDFEHGNPFERCHEQFVRQGVVVQNLDQRVTGTGPGQFCHASDGIDAQRQGIF